jgi:hypothetical protein
MESIIEVVDHTNDDMYYPIAVFKDLETAKHEIVMQLSEDDSLSEFAVEEYEKIVFRERKIGWSGNGKEVFVIEREEYYDEEKDKYLWRLLTPKAESDE